MTMVNELRHLDGIKGNMYLSETGYLAPATFHERGKPASHIILILYGQELFLQKRDLNK
jgi:two-component system, OmpR family, sensor histidine kinase VicK